jgi:tRNA1(Val) A37 N6-methylase TrmN6
MTDITALSAPGAHSEDGFLGGQLRLRQPRHGYRAGLDAALLAAACDAAPSARIVEAGCGAGAALLSAAIRRPATLLTGIEREADAVALARLNIDANGLRDRAQVIEGDVGRPFRLLGLEPFDAAICNPPFFDDPAALRPPAATRRAAWMADDGLAAWIGFLIKAVREGGTITLIHRADRLDDILALLAPKAGSVQVRPVHPFADAPAKRVLVRAVKTGKAPLRLLPALVLHERGGGEPTAEAAALLRGDAALPWL